MRRKRITVLRARLLLAACAAASLPIAVWGEVPDDRTIVVVGHRDKPFAAAPVADAELDDMHGKLLLPNGLDVSIGIDIQTRVDGFLALRTIFTTDGPGAGLRVLTGGAAVAPAPAGTGAVTDDVAESAASVTISRSPTGSTVELGGPAIPTNLKVSTGSTAAVIQPGETEVAATENGPSVSTPAGDVRILSNERGEVVTLDSADLQIQHLIGQATGVVVANSADGRSIDTVSAVNVDLRGLSPELAAGLALGDRIGLDIATSR